MLDAYTSDGQYAFQFDDLEQLAESWDDYGFPDDVAIKDLGANANDDSVLVVLIPSGHGSWHYRKIIGADQLQQALTQAGLLPER